MDFDAKKQTAEPAAAEITPHAAASVLALREWHFTHQLFSASILLSGCLGLPWSARPASSNHVLMRRPGTTSGLGPKRRAKVTGCS